MYTQNFLSKILVAMEESALTGEYDVRKMPRVNNCLKHLKVINNSMKPSEVNYIDDAQSLASSDAN